MDKLTPKQKRFIDCVVSGMNYTDAYRAAYDCSRMKPETVNNTACNLAHNPKIATRIEKGQKRASEKAEWTLALTIERHKKLNDMAMGTIEDYNESTGRIDERASNAFMQSAEKLDRYLGIDKKLAEDNEPDISLGADFGMLLPSAFIELHRDVHHHGHTDYLLPGGRASGKSSFVSLEILKLLQEHPDIHALVTRRVARTMRTSVYAQMEWALSVLNLTDQYECTVSPMQMVRKSTGQTIYFVGLDDADKIKGIKPKFGYIGIWWGEEADQYAGMNQMRSVRQSMTRSGDEYWRFFSWNPPRSKNNWVNAWADTPGENGCTFRSTYLDVPREWLGQTFIEDAEGLKEINETAYRHEYLGEMVGTDGDVFQNVVDETITQEDIDGFKSITCGVDWGYAVDPWVFIRCAYDRKSKTLYIFDEMHGLRLSNEETAKRTIERLRDSDGTFEPKLQANMILADAAEPKSIASWRAAGINCKAAPKWPNSVNAGIKWLQERTAIVIDRKRCPLAWTEFSTYEYETDKDGNTIEAYPDANNHTIDAVRYAMSATVAKKKEM